MYQVDALTARVRVDGYYESQVLDCDGNFVEITI